MEASAKRPGRPLDPAVSAAALAATLALLDEHGYQGLRVGDVAERAGIGLGALYRRWATKEDLVVHALRSVAVTHEQPDSRDAVADLGACLVAATDGLGARGGRLLALALAGEEPQLIAAVHTAKIAPLQRVLQHHVRRILGDVPDLAERADIGPALIVFRMISSGQPPTADEIRTRIVPLMLQADGPPAA